MAIKLLALLLTVCITSAFYWTVVQPVLLRRQVYRMFALRDNLRWLIIEGKIDEDGEHTKTFETIINAIVDNAPKMSLLHFILFVATRRDKEPLDDMAHYCREAPMPIKEMNHTAITASLSIMLLNSPILFLVFLALSQVKVFFVAPLQKTIRTIRLNSIAAENEERVCAFISKIPATM